MPLKDLLRRKDKPDDDERAAPPSGSLSPPVPEFTFMRTTTDTQEIIAPPTYPGDSAAPAAPSEEKEKRRLHSPFRRHSHNASLSPSPSPGPSPAPSLHSGDESSGLGSPGKAPKEHKRLSQRLHLRSRSASSTASVNVPADLPDIRVEVAKNDEDEALWEQRATLLAQGNRIGWRGAGGGAANVVVEEEEKEDGAGGKRSRSRSVSVGNRRGDENIQEAIRLHEAGELEQSTAMVGRLADPNGPNNALSQVLYGLALRHGWGCNPNPELAITYLSYAASNSAQVESLALSAGMKKGGAAKGELVLAIFELANCFRNGWGIKKDPVAAKQYYETAANLGDTDAMNEVAWCYLEGFGCKKDKFKAAQFLRLAEEKGSKTVGNTWIWKEKYNPKPEGGDKK